jgi:hypothetical protein
MVSQGQSSSVSAPVIPTYGNSQSSDYEAFYQMKNDYDQWLLDQKAQAADDEEVKSALASMEELMAEAKIGHNKNAEFMAMMLFFYQVMPNLMQQQQDNITALADSQNIDSDLRNFVTNIQGDINSGYTNSSGGAGSSYTINQPTAEDIMGNIADLKQWTTFLSTTSCNGTTPLDASDADNLLSNMSSIATSIGDTYTPGGSNFNTIAITVENTINGIYGEQPNNPQFQANQQTVSSIQQNLQQANSTTSSIATTTQTTEQFFVNQYNQFTGIDNSLQQSYASTNNSMVNNQKSN